MTNIKAVKIETHDGRELYFTDITQIYTIGNFITISGVYQEEFPASGISVKRYEIHQLKSMVVEF